METNKFSTKYHEGLIGRGKLMRHFEHPYETVTVIEIDLDHLAARLKTQVAKVLRFSEKLLEGFPGATTQMQETQMIRAAENMVDYAMFQVYNRLRTVAESVAPAVRQARMNTRAPYVNDHEIPEFLASTLGSIGPLFIEEGLAEQMIIYATSADRANRYGRAEVVNVNFQSLSLFNRALKRANIPTAKIDIRSTTQGSFFTTIIPVLANGSWTFNSTHVSTYYEDIDLVRAWLCLHDDVNFRATPYTALIIGENTTAAVTNAIIADRPQGVPAAVDGATQPADLIGSLFRANHFGIRPAVPAAGEAPAVPAATYILGRGNRTYLSQILGTRLSEAEMMSWAAAIMLGEA